MARSRLKNHLQEQSFRNILLALGGIIALLIFMFTLGPELLINFSLLVKKPSTEAEIKKSDLTYVAPPIFTTLEQATKSATIDINGYAESNQSIKLYVNGKQVKKTETKKDNQFTFTNVKLEKGINEIKAKVITENDKESNYSSILRITYIDKSPTLEVSSPQDGQTVSRTNGQVQITGKTDPGVRVTVNDFWAIVKDDGSFSYMLSIPEGETTVRIVAEDDANNQTTKEFKIKTG